MTFKNAHGPVADLDTDSRISQLVGQLKALTYLACEMRDNLFVNPVATDQREKNENALDFLIDEISDKVDALEAMT